jgi:hypothetical protein
MDNLFQFQKHRFHPMHRKYQPNQTFQTFPLHPIHRSRPNLPLKHRSLLKFLKNQYHPLSQ